ncbi:hypothetical protein ACEPW2_31015, partial [Pseudomonas aeruginosa]
CKGLEMVSTKNRWTPCREQEGSGRCVGQTLTGEAVAPHDGEFVSQALVERFQRIDTLAQLRGQLAQLLGRQVIESGRILGAECEDFWPPRR